jgi:hypothetical protein
MLNTLLLLVVVVLHSSSVAVQVQVVTALASQVKLLVAELVLRASYR